jgi:eukaryotic-like serine/threonine-protein kinase
VRRCLERDARNRLRDIGEARIALQACLSDSAEKPAVEEGVAGRKRTTGPIWTLAAALALCAAVAVWTLWPKAAPPAQATRFSVPLPENAIVDFFSVSPDGRKLLIDGSDAQGRALWIRDLDALDWKRLESTRNARRRPLWSPDGRFMAFAQGDDLKKMDLSGGPPQFLSTIAGGGSSGTWNRDGTILVGGGFGGHLYRIPETGGPASEVTSVETARGETGHDAPRFLPDGKHFVYFIRGSPEVQGIYVGSLEAKPADQPRKRIVPTQSAASYADGYLFFMRGDTLMVQPFDAGRLELKNEPRALAEHVDLRSPSTGIFAVSPATLAYHEADEPNPFQFTWFDRQGKISGASGQVGSGTGLALSPDGTRAAFCDSISTHPGDLWTLDLARGTRTRLTDNEDSSVRPAVWSSDGRRVIFAAGRRFTDTIYEKASSGAGEGKELLRKANENLVPTSLSGDGRFLLYHVTNATPTDDLWVLPLMGDHKPIPLLATRFNERSGAFSPNTRWIAYKSDETGRWEIYVRPFLGAGPSGAPELGEGKWQISKDGAANIGSDLAGGFPRWRADGREILFGGPGGAVMAVEVTTNGGNFQPGVPKKLFTLPPNAGPWDITPDGKKLLAPVSLAAQPSRKPVTVVLNWRAELNR